jgi:hypothetical protein
MDDVAKAESAPVITRFLGSADFPLTGAVVGQLVGARHGPDHLVAALQRSERSRDSTRRPEPLPTQTGSCPWYPARRTFGTSSWRRCRNRHPPDRQRPAYSTGRRARRTQPRIPPRRLTDAGPPHRRQSTWGTRHLPAGQTQPRQPTRGRAPSRPAPDPPPCSGHPDSPARRRVLRRRHRRLRSWRTVPANITSVTGAQTVYLTFASGRPQDFVNVNRSRSRADRRGRPDPYRCRRPAGCGVAVTRWAR